MIDADSIKSVRSKIRGRIIERQDSDYEQARQLYNAMIDKKPRMIVQCVDVADVIAAVRFAGEHDLLTAIRSGGHNGPGLGSCNDGLVIDLSMLNGVRVDPVERTVRAEAGCTQGAVEHAAHAFGLAVPAGIVSTTGIAGLTLGGGHGYLARRFGLTIDNLLEADVVLANGRFVTANEKENADLFWALRGGGGNFGVVTSFLYRAQAVSEVFGGPIFWDIEHAREIMQWYRQFLPRAPLELCPFLGLKTVPSTDPFPREIRGRKICALICCYSGSLDQADEAFKPIRRDLPAALLDWVGTMPFPALQSLFDPLFPKGLQWYWKGDFVKELPDEVIDVHLKYNAKAPSELSLVHFYPIDGVVHQVKQNETAWNCRDATWSMVIAAIDPNPAKAPALATWAKEYWEAVHPFTMGGAYVNFMMEEGENRIKATYGDNYERLVRVKDKYDPANFFHVNQNIPPSA
jgi:hypothetical protein